MARRTRRKFYTRKGRWAGNIRTVTDEALAAPSGSFFGSIDLATNPVQSSSTVSQVFTVKNIELSYQLENRVDHYSIEGLCSFIMYVPEGYVVTETLPNTHPEWIMAYRWLGSPDFEWGQGTTGRLPSKIKTRMSRRLQSGDKIVLLITGTNTTDTDTTVYFSGLLRWWTKAN